MKIREERGEKREELREKLSNEKEWLSLYRMIPLLSPHNEDKR